MVEKTFQDKTGLPPGALVYVGDKASKKSRITVIDYNDEYYEQRQTDDLDEIFAYLQKPSVTWINVVGIQDVSLIREMGARLNLHVLLLEDILNTEHRSKIDLLESQTLLIVKMLHLDANQPDTEINCEHLAIVMGKNYVITFQEDEADPFDGIRNQLRNFIGQIRTKPADYLTYRLLDMVVDHYLLITEQMAERIEAVEEAIVEDPSKKVMTKIYALKREANKLRSAIHPVREVINQFQNRDNQLIHENTHIYLQDLQDHMIRAYEMSESIKASAALLLEVYFSSISSKMNEVMKVLTIVSTIFIPLTFIAGVYGMNFVFMPELEWRWGYPLVMTLMGGVFGGMLVFFYKRKWI
jgi:magnesium transporter